MNEFRSKPLLGRPLIAGLLLAFSTTSLCQLARFTSNDPAPVYSAGNPLAMFTGWEDCEQEQRARFTLSTFRQSACKGRAGAFTEGSCPANTCTDCTKVCDKDVEIGNIHGRWNMTSLFYPEENNDVTVATDLQSALGIDATDITECFSEATGKYNISNPKNHDTNQLLGFFDVPIEYRKHGVRFEADIDTCWDIGLRIQMGVASISQDADFTDKTCSGSGNTCTVLDDNGSITQCILNNIPCDCKKLIINKIMKQKDIVADTLGLSIDDYCETDIEDLTLSLYWSHCFEVNAEEEKQNDCWSHYTFTPYAMGHFSAPMGQQAPVAKTFALPFGNNDHLAYGFTGGFTINFVETVELGIEAGFTKYSDEKYGNHPVPTHELQTGMFPRKADLCIEPGSTWTFGATLGSYHFLDCLSSYIQFRSVHHCRDTIKVLDVVKRSTSDTFVVENIKVQKMQDESQWSSNFVNVNFDYDIGPNMALGFHWQAPVRQKHAYRPTTVMGSVICKF